MREGTPLLASVLGGTLEVHVFTLSEDQRRVYCVAKDDIVDEDTDLCPEALAIKFKGVQIREIAEVTGDRPKSFTPDDASSGRSPGDVEMSSSRSRSRSPRYGTPGCTVYSISVKLKRGSDIKLVCATPVDFFTWYDGLMYLVTKAKQEEREREDAASSLDLPVFLQQRLSTSPGPRLSSLSPGPRARLSASPAAAASPFQHSGSGFFIKKTDRIESMADTIRRENLEMQQELKQKEALLSRLASLRQGSARRTHDRTYDKSLYEDDAEVEDDNDDYECEVDDGQGRGAAAALADEGEQSDSSSNDPSTDEDIAKRFHYDYTLPTSTSLGEAPARSVISTLAGPPAQATAASQLSTMMATARGAARPSTAPSSRTGLLFADRNGVRYSTAGDEGTMRSRGHLRAESDGELGLAAGRLAEPADPVPEQDGQSSGAAATFASSSSTSTSEEEEDEALPTDGTLQRLMAEDFAYRGDEEEASSQEYDEADEQLRAELVDELLEQYGYGLRGSEKEDEDWFFLRRGAGAGAQEAERRGGTEEDYGVDLPDSDEEDEEGGAVFPPPEEEKAGGGEDLEYVYGEHTPGRWSFKARPAAASKGKAAISYAAGMKVAAEQDARSATKSTAAPGSCEEEADLESPAPPCTEMTITQPLGSPFPHVYDSEKESVFVNYEKKAGPFGNCKVPPRSTTSPRLPTSSLIESSSYDLDAADQPVRNLFSSSTGLTESGTKYTPTASTYQKREIAEEDCSTTPVLATDNEDDARVSERLMTLISSVGAAGTRVESSKVLLQKELRALAERKRLTRECAYERDALGLQDSLTLY